MSPRPASPHSPRPSRAGRLALTVLMALVVGVCEARASDDAPPEIVRVRLRWDEVARHLPAGSAIRTVPLDRFEALAAATRGGSTHLLAPETPRRPTRVDHEARWDGVALTGRSDVTLPDSRSPVACRPWSPALRGVDPPARAWADPAGDLFLARGDDPATRRAALAWSHSAVPGSAGRVFALRLPEADVGRLVLDLPLGVRPAIEGAETSGPRPRPLPGDPPAPGRVFWEVVGASGPVPLSLIPDDPAARGSWVGGSTRIDLADATDANWVARWEVHANDPGPTRLTIDLPGDLDLIDVTGPDLVETRTTATGHRPAGLSRVVATLRDGAASRPGGTPLTIRGLARPPLVGSWPVPTARPADARWTGGSVTVLLGSGRPLASVEVGSGRRVAPEESPAAPGTTAFAFEDDGKPGPLATFRFGPPSGASVAIRGTLRLGAGRPRLAATATWTGAPADLTLDVPPGWTIERVGRVNGTPPPAWSTETVLGGATRVHLACNGPGGTTTASGAIVVEAIGTGGASGPDGGRVVLPRVRFGVGSGPVVAAERWEARVEPGWEAEPVDDRGLVWVDPDPAPVSQAAPPSSADDVPALPLPEPTTSTGPALAWVWLDPPTGPDEAPGSPPSLTLRRLGRVVRVGEQVEAAVVGDRLRVEWRWSIAAAGRPPLLPFRVEIPPDRLPRWRAEAPGESGRLIEPIRLEPAEAAALGWESGQGGSAFALPLDRLRPGPLTLRAEADLPWPDSGSIPLVTWPSAVVGERSVVVRVEDAARVRLDRVEGLIPAPRPPSPAGPAAPGAGGTEPNLRVAGSWTATGSGPALLSVTTERGNPVGPGAWITEAVLTTRMAPGVESRHRLILRIATDSARAVPLTMPARATLERVRRDGQAATTTQDGPAVRVNVPATFPAHSPATITLDYRTPPEPDRPGVVRPADLLPRVDLPCLSFAWQLKTPADRAARSLAPDLILAEPALAPTEPAPTRRSITGPDDAPETLADLGAILGRSPPLETTLGDWLVRLDSGRRPLLIDRLALQAEGWGPRSRINLADFDPARPGDPRAAFEALGLAIEPVGPSGLVTTRSEVRTGARRLAALGPGSNGFADLLADAAGSGSDPSGRYLTPACWRGEATPRAWLASETPDRDFLAQGWRSTRFVAPVWPGPGVAVALERPTVTPRLVALAALGGLSGLALVLVPAARRVRAGRPTTALRRFGGRLAPLLLLPTLLGWSPPGQTVPPGAILVLIPSGDPAATDPPDAVALIRAEDLDRLARWADRGRADVDRPPPEVRILGATHRVEPPESGRAVVRSRFDLEVVGGHGVASWTFPAGGGVELAATVDGQARALAIGPDAQTATVGGLTPGRRVVEFVRLVPCRPEPDGLGWRIDEPVAAFPNARVEVAPNDRAWAAVDLPDSAEPRDDRFDRVEAPIGPTGRVAVVWRDFEPAEEGGAGVQAEIAALVRWDSDATGDLVTLRGTVVGPASLRAIRLGLEPGLVVRRSAIPGLVGATADGTPGRPEWSAFVDPPLRPGARFEVACQRAGSVESGAGRRAPRLELLGVSAHGLVGLRVPAGWSGRLEPGPGVVAPSASSAREFARRWGLSLPEGLGPAGLARLDALPTLVAHLAPASAPLAASDGVAVAIEPGRLRFASDSVLRSDGPLNWEAEATFPGPVRVDRVEAPALAAWDQPRPDTVRLVFAEPEPPGGRTIRLEGSARWGSAGDGARPIEAPVPRPRWRGGRAEPARLTVVGPESLAVVGPGGGAPLGEAQPNFGEVEAPAWEARRWSGSGPAIDQACLRWEPVPPRVNLVLRSDLLALESRLVWRAEVEVAVSGGPARSVAWRLPSAWAASARIASDGRPVAVRAEDQGDSTLWTIPLDLPIWHRRTLTIEASRPWAAGEAILYPAIEVPPRAGRGRVTRYDLGFANASGVTLEPEASGLTTLVGPSPGGSAPSSGVGTLNYRVAAERWSLRLAGRGGAGEPRPEPGPTRAFDDETQRGRPEWAHLDLMVAAESILGRAEVQVEPGGAFLAVDLPGAATCLGASVDGRLTRPQAMGGPAGPRRCLIPLGDGAARRVILTWTQDRAGPDGACALPAFGPGAVRTTVRLSSTGADRDWSIRGGNWARQAPGLAALTRVDRLAETLIDPTSAALTGLNQAGDPAEPGSVVDRLATLLLAARTAGRAHGLGAAGNEPAGPGAGVGVRVEAMLDRVRAALGQVGREDLFREAEERVGREAPGPGSSLTDGGSDAPDPLRVRPLGATRSFQGVTSGDPSVPTVLVPATGG